MISPFFYAGAQWICTKRSTGQEPFQHKIGAPASRTLIALKTNPENYGLESDDILVKGSPVLSKKQKHMGDGLMRVTGPEKALVTEETENSMSPDSLKRLVDLANQSNPFILTKKL